MSELKPLIGVAAERTLTRTEAETAFETFFEACQIWVESTRVVIP